MVTLNGAPHTQGADKHLLALLTSRRYHPARIVVELNGAIVPKADYDRTILQDGDVLEVLHFVGGG